MDLAASHTQGVALGSGCSCTFGAAEERGPCLRTRDRHPIHCPELTFIVLRKATRSRRELHLALHWQVAGGAETHRVLRHRPQRRRAERLHLVGKRTPRAWMLVPRPPMAAARARMRSPCRRKQTPGVRMPDARSPREDARGMPQDAHCLRPDAKSSCQDARSPRPEARSWREDVNSSVQEDKSSREDGKSSRALTPSLREDASS